MATRIGQPITIGGGERERVIFGAPLKGTYAEDALNLEQRINLRVGPTRQEQAVRSYLDSVISRDESGLTPEADIISRMNVMVLGTGISGGNVAFELARAVQSTTGEMKGTWFIVDPENVEMKNVGLQPYEARDVEEGLGKADAMAKNIKLIAKRQEYSMDVDQKVEVIDLMELKNEWGEGEKEKEWNAEKLKNFAHSKDPDIFRIIKIGRGLRISELHTFAKIFDIDLIVDGVDFTEPDAVLSAHQVAAYNNIPLVSALDLMDHFQVSAIEHPGDQNRTYEDGLFTPQEVENYKRIRAVENTKWRLRLIDAIQNGQPISEKDMTAGLYRTLKEKGRLSREDIKGDSPSARFASYYLVIKNVVKPENISQAMMCALFDHSFNNGNISLPSTGRVMGAVAAGKAIEMVLSRAGVNPPKFDIGLNTGVDFTDNVKNGVSKYDDYLPTRLLDHLNGSRMTDEQVKRKAEELFSQIEEAFFFLDEYATSYYNTVTGADENGQPYYQALSSN